MSRIYLINPSHSIIKSSLRSFYFSPYLLRWTRTKNKCGFHTASRAATSRAIQLVDRLHIESDNHSIQDSENQNDDLYSELDTDKIISVYNFIGTTREIVKSDVAVDKIRLYLYNFWKRSNSGQKYNILMKVLFNLSRLNGKAITPTILNTIFCNVVDFSSYTPNQSGIMMTNFTRYLLSTNNRQLLELLIDHLTKLDTRSLDTLLKHIYQSCSIDGNYEAINCFLTPLQIPVSTILISGKRLDFHFKSHLIPPFLDWCLPSLSLEHRVTIVNNLMNRYLYRMDFESCNVLIGYLRNPAKFSQDDILFRTSQSQSIIDNLIIIWRRTHNPKDLIPLLSYFINYTDSLSHLITILYHDLKNNRLASKDLIPLIDQELRLPTQDRARVHYLEFQIFLYQSMGDLTLLQKLIDHITYEKIILPPKASRTILSCLSRCHLKFNEVFETFEKFQQLDYNLNLNHYLELIRACRLDPRYYKHLQNLIVHMRDKEIDFNAKFYQVLLKTLLNHKHMDHLSPILQMMADDHVNLDGKHLQIILMKCTNPDTNFQTIQRTLYIIRHMSIRLSPWGNYLAIKRSFMIKDYEYADYLVSNVVLQQYTESSSQSFPLVYYFGTVARPESLSLTSNKLVKLFKNRSMSDHILHPTALRLFQLTLFRCHQLQLPHIIQTIYEDIFKSIPKRYWPPSVEQIFTQNPPKEITIVN